jgi:methylated-DNA-protein-cysteine methyltransferase-like protein
MQPPWPDDAAASAAEATAEERICLVVAMIPPGSVATYGQVAALAGMPRHARLVGRVLRNLPRESRLPWHRVVNAALRISTRAGDGAGTQRQRLEAEGVSFVGERVAASQRWAARPN